MDGMAWLGVAWTDGWMDGWMDGLIDWTEGGKVGCGPHPTFRPSLPPSLRPINQRYIMWRRRVGVTPRGRGRSLARRWSGEVGAPARDMRGAGDISRGGAAGPAGRILTPKVDIS
eukprot:scaffold2428_cov412-Prasinococcus_capsulatus_cf.AAC.20